MSKNVPRKEMPQMAFTTQAASSPSLFYLLGSGEKMQRCRRGFLKLCELVPRFPWSGGAVPRIYQLGPRGPEEKHTPFGGPQSLDLTGAWDTGGTSRNPISAPPHSTYHRTGHVHLLLSAAWEV